MSKLFIRIFLLFYSVNLCAQDPDQIWDQYLNQVPEKISFYLAKGKPGIDMEVIRRLDANHSIVRLKNGGVRLTENLIPVNNSWKSNIDWSKEPSLFFVKTIGAIDWDQYVGVELIGKYKGTCLIKTSPQLITELINSPKIIHISNESVDPSIEARVIDMNLNPNRINKIHHFFPELDGAGRTISIQENQYDKNDLDLLGRNVESTLGSEIIDIHSTEMATIIAGAGNSFLTGRGVAMSANITTSDFVTVLPDADEDYQSLNVRIQNHSYGTVIESFYGAQAEAFDQSAHDNPELLHVFSSGNQGTAVSTDGKYAGVSGFANLTGNFKMAKNVLVVGSVDTTGNEVVFSSRGPAYDGRIKPELAAYSVVGSSNSAALVSGTAALLQQQYQVMNGTEMPASLTRALLINSSEDIHATGPDYVTGYGSINAYESLRSLQNNQIYSGVISDGEAIQFALSVPVNARDLKITLSWTDPPSDIGSFKALVNDLDIRLLNSSNEETLPWILSTTANSEDLVQAATRGKDRLNNNEQISIETTDDLNYTIEVMGFDVTGSQEFFVVYQYDQVETFEWDYPTGSDNMPYNGESGSYFRWKSTLTETEGVLEFSVDDGLTWEVLDSNVDLSMGYWRWNQIPDLTTTALARIRTATQSFVTEDFTISRPLDVSVGFVCSDSVRLQWPQVTGVSNYEVSNMGSKFLEPFQTTTDTAIVIKNAGGIADYRFSVLPIMETKPLLPSATLDYTRQGIECFVFSFFQEVALDTGIYLNLQLGTVYGIERITFKRVSASGNRIIDVIEAPENPEIRILDDAPNQGNNIHSMVIDFINGEQIEQQVTNTWYLTEVPILIFPNPVVNTSELNVFTKEPETINPVFRIFDAKGIEVVSVPVKSTQNNIPLNGLRSGLYFYRFEDGSAGYSGRFVIK
ncbi:MAG: S8 family serine peptidase [Cyclobacteriaceae bacterium]